MAPMLYFLCGRMIYIYVTDNALFSFSARCRPLKIREEADPFSLDMGVLEKGNIVKVLEVLYGFLAHAVERRER